MSRHFQVAFGLLYIAGLSSAQTYTTQPISFSWQSGGPAFSCDLPTPDGSEVPFPGGTAISCNEPYSIAYGSGVTWGAEYVENTFTAFGGCASQQLYWPAVYGYQTGISGYAAIIDEITYPQSFCVPGGIYCQGSFGIKMGSVRYDGEVACDYQIVIVSTPNCATNTSGSCGSCGTVQCDGSCVDPCSGGGGGGGESGGSAGCSEGSCVNDYDCNSGQGCIDNCCIDGQGNGSAGGNGGGGGTACADSCYEAYGGGDTFNCIDLACGDIMNQCDTNCNGDCTCAADEDPIVIDLAGKGYAMTSYKNGVMFDILADGKPIQMAWTAPGENIGFLALDRNGNGKIDNGAELFSNIAAQPGPGLAKNGFRALAVYDQPANGGNRDGWIDAKDAIYSKLVIWVDKNHNGVTDPGELMTLPQAGIKAISVHDQPNKWTDAFGNQFRFSSNIVWNTGKTEEIYDVFLVTADNPVSAKK